METDFDLLQDLLKLGFGRTRLVGKFDRYSQEEIAKLQRWSDSWKGPEGERISEICLREFEGILNPSYCGVIKFENQVFIDIAFITRGHLIRGHYAEFIIKSQQWRLSPTIKREIDSGKVSPLGILALVVEYHFAKPWTLYKWQELVIGKVKCDRHLKGLPPKVKRRVF